MIARRVLRDVRRALGRQAATALLGPRQVGKTTLARQLAGTTKSLYLDLQSAADRARLTDPRHFLGQYEDQLVILDEIHRVPALFPELRGLIDEGRVQGRRTGRFLILGSASVDLLKQAGESLAGRIEFTSLNPLDVLEVAPDEAAATSLWVRGGFPDSFLARSDEDSLAFRQNFIRTYLERDLAEFIQTRMPSETLARLWTMLAHEQGGLLNIAKLARSLAISAPSVMRYVDVLKSLLLVRRLPPFVANVRKRLVKSPKVYIRDSGLVHALLDIESFHTAAGAEIDLVLEVPGIRRPIAVEIKRRLAPSLGKGFHSAYKDIGAERAFVVYAGSERYPVAESTEVIGLRAMAGFLADPHSLRA